MQELQELVTAANNALLNYGVRLRFREVDGHMEGQMLLPTRPRPVVVTARLALPTDNVGAILKGPLAKKAKAIAKRLLKSKLLGKIAKFGPLLAMVPGGQVIAAAAMAAKAAQKIAKAAKKGNPAAKKFAAAASKVATKKLAAVRSRSSSTARVAPPGYPRELASSQPGPQPSGDYGASPQNFGDADPGEMEQAMDPPVDTSDFGGSDSSWPEGEDAGDAGDAGYSDGGE